MRYALVAIALTTFSVPSFASERTVVECGPNRNDHKVEITVDGSGQLVAHLLTGEGEEIQEWDVIKVESTNPPEEGASYRAHGFRLDTARGITYITINSKGVGIHGEVITCRED